jgi:hypothetical protein
MVKYINVIQFMHLIKFPYLPPKRITFIYSKNNIANMDGDYSERRISEFNEAIFQIQRLHALWIECKSRRQNGDLIGLRYSLDSAEIELSVDAGKIDKENHKEDSPDGYNSRLKKVNEEIDKIVENKDINSFRSIYKLFLNKEKMLRQLQEDSGKGSKTKLEGDEFEM